MSKMYFGVVEDRRSDSLRLGRCKVRIVGVHTEDKVILPTEDLPWAMPMQPIHSAATSGVGTAPVGVVEGSWVVIQFIDDNFQYPVMIGTIGGYNEDLPFEFDNQDTIGKAAKADQTLDVKPANEADDKANAGGLAAVASPAALAAALPDIQPSAKEVVQAFNDVKTGAQASITSALATLESTKASLLNVASEATNAAAASFSKVNTSLSNLADDAFSAVSSAIDDAINSAVSQATSLVSGIEKSISAMTTQLDEKLNELKQLSESIDPEKMMAELNDLVRQAGEKAEAGVDNVGDLISAGLMKFDEIKTDVEKIEVVRKVEEALADLSTEAQQAVISVTDDVLKQYSIIKELGLNGTSMQSNQTVEAQLVVKTADDNQPDLTELPNVFNYGGLAFTIDTSGNVRVNGQNLNSVNLGHIDDLTSVTFNSAAANPAIPSDGATLLNRIASKAADIKARLRA